MSFFKGHEIYSIDNKGRVNIPVKMRKELSPQANGTFTITRGYGKCIAAYPKDEWQRYAESYKKLNQFNGEALFFLRTMLMWCEDVTLDAQQRIAIPQKLIEFADIENKVVIAGVMDRIEIWNPVEFEKYKNSYSESFEDVASKVMTVQ